MAIIISTVGVTKEFMNIDCIEDNHKLTSFYVEAEYFVLSNLQMPQLMKRERIYEKMLF